MLKKILIGLLVVVALLVAFIATRPSGFTVARTATIHAPPEAVFAQVVDLKAWQRWSPWEEKDPGMQRVFGEVSSGVGALYHWVGNREVGEGTMTITEAKPPERIALALDFVKPMPGHSDVVFAFARSGDDTTVTWTMSGRNGFVGKAFCLVMDMDKMVGGDFEQGLARLRARCEAPAAGAPPAK